MFSGLFSGTASMALLSALLWGGGDFAGGLGVKRAGGKPVGALLVVMLSHAVTLTALLAIVFAQGAVVPHGALLGWGLLAGLAAGISLSSFYMALSRGAMGASAAVSGLLAAAIPAGVSMGIEGAPSPLRLGGFALAAVAIWMIAAGAGIGSRAARNHLVGGDGGHRLRRLLHSTAHGQPARRLHADGTRPPSEAS